MSVLRVVFRCLVWLAFLLIGASGLLKLADLEQFATSLDGWTIIPRAISPIVVVVVPSIELTLTSAWMVSRRRASIHLAIVMIGLYTVTYGVQWAIVKPPTCNCFGALVRYETMFGSGAAVVIRNLLLMGMLTAGYAARVHRAERLHAENPPHPHPSGDAHVGAS